MGSKNTSWCQSAQGTQKSMSSPKTQKLNDPHLKPFLLFFSAAPKNPNKWAKQITNIQKPNQSAEQIGKNAENRPPIWGAWRGGWGLCLAFIWSRTCPNSHRPQGHSSTLITATPPHRQVRRQRDTNQQGMASTTAATTKHTEEPTEHHTAGYWPERTKKTRKPIGNPRDIRWEWLACLTLTRKAYSSESPPNKK